MSDEPVSQYAANIDLAMSLMPSVNVKNGCEACVKEGLPVLLVRAGLADALYAQSKQATLSPWLDQQTAPVVLSYSRYVMRPLRQGYVMAYYEKPHTPHTRVQKGWQVFRVTEGGYMKPHYLDIFPANTLKHPEDFSCTRTASYATAMLFVIPYAQNTGKVWVAYSDHPFSESVRERYAQDATLRAQRMSEVNALNGQGARRQPISEALISQTLADYDPELPRFALRGNPHAPLELTDTPGVAQKR
ncbi:hypothetical protein HX776_24655, partial [Pseudomonas agarici]